MLEVIHTCSRRCSASYELSLALTPQLRANQLSSSTQVAQTIDHEIRPIVQQRYVKSRLEIGVFKLSLHKKLCLGRPRDKRRERNGRTKEHQNSSD